MRITWLGQAGLLFEWDGFTVMIDPYLSDSVEKLNPQNYRRVPIKRELLDIRPDVMIFTHDHLDHYDPETVPHFITADTNVTVLAPTSVWSKVRLIGGGNNFVMFDRHTEWSEHGFRFTAVKAAHSDEYAIGVVIYDIAEGKRYYVTGDTLYSSEIFDDLPSCVDIVFLPINGVGNNMNACDAARLVGRIGAKYAVPMHFGMFDDIDPHVFEFGGRVIPEIYKEIEF